MRICVVGLGKLGAPLFAVLADCGFEVVGVDHSQSVVDALNSGRAPVEEPGLQTLLDGLSKRPRASSAMADAVRESDVTLVIVPTPSLADGTFSSAHVEAVVREIGGALRGHGTPHVVAILSTLMPGTMGGVVTEALESSAGRKLGPGLGLCYSPEFIALGSVIANLRSPDFVLIGESDPEAGERLSEIYRRVCTNAPPISRTNFVNAEIAKLAVNVFVTTKISFTNMLSEICERKSDADADVVAEILGLDRRIGSTYMRPALGYGGPCFPRDNKAMSALANQLGVTADIAEATDRINSRQVRRIVSLVQRRLPNGTVGVLGLAYKPGTSVCEESQGVAIAVALASAGYKVVAYDPAVRSKSMAPLPANLELGADMESCVRNSNLVLVTTPWPEFNKLASLMPDGSGRRVPVIDCWRMPGLAESSALLEVIYPGRGS